MHVPTFPTGLAVTVAAGEPPPAMAVVLVHGSLDRAASFQRTTRRLPEMMVVSYDRRGYAGSRDGSQPEHGPATAGYKDHVADLLGVIDALQRDVGTVVVLGHSFGGDVAIGAALAEPACIGAVGAYEPPMPWLGFRRTPPDAPPALREPATAPADHRGDPPSRDPGQEAVAFFKRMVGANAWERLPEATREQRRAEGPALLADMAAFRGPALFDVTALEVPSVFGCGGPASAPHHRQTVHWLADHVPGAELFEIEDAGHGAHLSHPDAFAGMARAVAARAGSGTS